MSKKMITELPVTAEDPVTFTYLHNHLFQVKAWIGNLNRSSPHPELQDMYELIDTAQDVIEKLIKEKGEK